MTVWASTLFSRRLGRFGTPREWDRQKLVVLLAVTGLAVGSGWLVGRGNPAVPFAIGAALPAVALVIKYPFAGIIMWLVVMPFAGLGGTTGQASPLLWAVHRVGVPALLALMVSYDLLGWKRSTFRLGLADAALALFLVCGSANVLLFSPQPTREFVSFYDHIAVPIAFFWLIRLIAPAPADLRRLLPVGVWTILTQSVIGALSWLAPSVLPSQWLGARAGERVTGTFGGPGPYTIGIIFFVMLLIYWTTGPRRNASSGLLLAVVGVGLFSVIISLSRGSWLGATVAFAGLGLIHRRLVLRLAFALGILITLLAFGPLSSAISLVTDRIEDADTVDARIMTNDAAVRMVIDRPVEGFGYGNFELFDEGYKQRVGDIPLKIGGSAHNTYLNLAVEFGIPATIAYLATPAVLLLMTFRLRKRLRVLPGSLSLILVLWVALLDQFVVNNFAEMIHSSAWATSIWWITLGLIAVELNRALMRPYFAGPSGARPAGHRTGGGSI